MNRGDFMYYKMQGNTPPAIKAGCAYDESYFMGGYLYLKYSQSNIPSEPLGEITQEEYEANKPIIPEPASEPTEEEILQAEILLNQQWIINWQIDNEAVLAEILLGQQGSVM